MNRRYAAQEGFTFQAYEFALDPTPAQRGALARQFGGRRFAYNWTVEALKADIDAFHENGFRGDAPSFYTMRARWNREKRSRCLDGNGEPWWQEISKEAFASGVRGAVDGFWQWQSSKDSRANPVGFPQFKSKSSDSDRFTVTTGSFGLSDRRHAKIPKVGRVRLSENARRVERLLSRGRARILAMTIRRRADRLFVVFRVEVLRPQANVMPSEPRSQVGIDVGVRRLATVANADGAVLEIVESPHALERNLAELRRLNRQLARRTPGSTRYRETTKAIASLHAHIRNVRVNHVHAVTTRLAKTHGRIVVEGMNVASLYRQRGLGARTRRRGLADAAVAESRRQLRYKCAWYGSEYVEADRFFASTKTCHRCGRVNAATWRESWSCEQCDLTHQRDDNAAINLARWHPPTSDLGTVGAPVKQGATRKSRQRRAAGDDLRKRDG